MEKIKLNKGILNEIDQGCIRLAVNLTMKKNERYRSKILEKIGLEDMPIEDYAAIREYQKRGYRGELEKLSELLCIKDIKIIGGKAYEKSGNEKYESFTINKTELSNIMEQCDKNKIDPRKNLRFYSDKEDLYNIFRNNDMIYQFSFKADDEFLEKLSNKYKISPMVKNYIDIFDSEIDLVRIVKNNNKDYKEKVFSGDNFCIKKASKDYILEVIDIKTSKEINQYRLELAMYMLKLHSFIQSRKDLKDNFEVSTKGFIMKQIQCETKLERKNRLSKINLFEDINSKEVHYEEVEERLINLLEKDLEEFLALILEGKGIEKYINFNLSPKCRLCSGYGGQRSKKIRSDAKEEYSEEWKDDSKNEIELIDKYYKENCDKLQLCRYLSKNKKSENLNNISELNFNNKKYLLENKVMTQEILKENFDDDVIRSNKYILSNREEILNSISIKQDTNKNWRFKSEYLRTTNLPTFADISIYIDEKSEPGGNNLCYAYKFTIPERLPLKNERCKKFTKNDCDGFFYIQTNTVEEQRRNFLDFLISINERLIKIEKNYKGMYDNIPRYAIYYWGNPVFEKLKEYFKLVWKYIKSDGENIEELGYEDSIIEEKKKDIKLLKIKLGSIFETQEDLPDNMIIKEKQKIVKTVPFFNLKKAAEDLIVLNEDINITLESYSRLFLNKQFYFLDKYIIDSNELDGRYISKILGLYKKDTNEKNKIITTFKHVITERLNLMNALCININRKVREQTKKYPGLITAPRITRLNNNEYEDTMLNDLYIYNKLNTGIALMDLINNQNLDTHKKNITGECIILDEKLELKHDDKTLIKNYDDTKNIYLKYKLNEYSIETKLDEKSIGLVFYPIDKREFYYKSFYKKGLFMSKYEGYEEPLNSPIADNYIIYNDDEIDKYLKGKKYGKYTYQDNFELKIEKIDRFNKFVIISYNKSLDTLIKLMENEYYFDFSKDLLIEPTYIDTWSKKLEKTLDYLIKNKSLVEIIKDSNTILPDQIKEEELYTALESHYGKNNIKLDPSQTNAILESLNNKINLIFGPPGTGKTWTISNLILTIYNMNNKAKILIMGNYNATDKILEKLSENNNFKEDISIYRIRTDTVEEKSYFDENIYEDINKEKEKEKRNKWRQDNPGRTYTEDIRCKIKKYSQNKNIIVTSTSQQVAGFLFTKTKYNKIDDFDYVIVDEASQMSVGNFLPSLLVSNENTQFIICGDDKQLGIITNIDMSKSKETYYQSIYEYFKMNNINESQLKINRRSNKSIVEFTSYNFGYEGYIADANNENITVNYKNNIRYSDKLSNILLTPKNTIILVEHFEELSSKQNNFEADLIIDQIKKIYEMGLLDKDGNQYNDTEFFTKGIGVVVPHRAQKSYIQNKLVDYFKSRLSSSMSMDKIIELSMLSTDTVEKYQGGERDIILCSYTVSDIDWIKNEEEFIYNPRRLNVMISRAKCKVIVIASNSLLDYVSENDDTEEMQKHIKNLKYYLNNVEKNLTYNNKKINIRYTTLQDK